MARAYTGSASHYHKINSDIFGGWPRTIAAWFYCDSDTGNTETIVGNGAGSGAYGGVRFSVASGTAGNPFRMYNSSASGSPTNSADTSNSVSYGVWQHGAATCNATGGVTACVLNGDWANRGSDTSSSLTWGTAATLRTAFGGLSYYAGALNLFTGDIGPVTWWNVELSQVEIEALAAGVHPLRIRPGQISGHWEMNGIGDALDLVGGNTITEIGTVGLVSGPVLLKRSPVVVPFAVRSAAVTGSASITEAADSSSASGTVTAQGSAAITEAADVSTASGLVTVSGTAAVAESGDLSTATGLVFTQGSASITEAADVSTGVGSVAGAVTGAASITEAADSSSASGTVTTTGAAAVTEAADVSTGVGLVTGPTTGVAAITEAADVSTGVGQVTIVGAAAITEAPDVSTGVEIYFVEGYGPVAILDTSIFFGKNFGFAESVFYQGQQLWGIYHGYSAEATDRDGPRVSLAQSDVDDQGIELGDQLVIRGTALVVTARQDDGHGTSRLILQDPP